MSAEVSAIFSNDRAIRSTSPARAATLSSKRAFFAMFVLMPPGWMVVHDTGARSISSSMRNASVKPRTANFDAL
ncbi:MAG TPA: hypothetical protein VM262_02525 [Acidimicrobiales bacterium]|nr:hypothetical protein [Acidimicrobiales bacterium]